MRRKRWRANTKGHRMCPRLAWGPGDARNRWPPKTRGMHMANQLNVADIQGFVLRGYNFPFARYLLLELEGPEKGRDFIGQIIPHVTTGQRWENGKPQSTVNIAFTHKGLVRLGLPDATLLSFPVEFFQGMKARKEILCDTVRNASENWDEVWRKDAVHVWLGVNALTPAALDERCAEMERIMKQTGGARLLEAQEAKAVVIDSKPTNKEHFGFTDGFGNPDFEGAERHSQPGQGKLSKEGDWIPLATGEFILGYADEAGELPVAPVPHLLANNGTFMVYRKLHQNVASFRNYLDAQSAAYAGVPQDEFAGGQRDPVPLFAQLALARLAVPLRALEIGIAEAIDRKSTRLNSS